MRRYIMAAVIAGTQFLLMSSGALSQQGGWKPCPRCQTDAQRNAAKSDKDHPFDVHDLSGIWGRQGIAMSNDVPPMTAWGKAKYDTAKPGMGPRAVPLGNDPMMICDPLGFPRFLNYNYGMEFGNLPGRTMQFFETYHTFRTIWTDGRSLPKDPEPRWLGYSVGKWEGDTFVVDSNGFDDRSWIDTQGHQHSDEMTTHETYRRLSYDRLEVTLTINDPKTYTKPWVSKGALNLSSGTEMGEYFCVPSEEDTYRKSVRERAAKPTNP
jgi:hypothetical protein